MKVLIVGLDGAEYDIIANGDFPHLKQVEFGRVEINVKPLFTPVVWASFITGKVTEEHGIRGMHKWKSGLIDKLRNWSLNTGLSHKMIGKNLIRLGRFLEFLGLETKLYDKSDLDASTIFDYVDKTIVISVPSYNEDSVDQLINRKEMEALRSGNRKLMKETVDLAWKTFEENKEKVLHALTQDWSLFMVHFFVLDPLQHLFWNDNESVDKAYAKLDETVKLIEEKLMNVEHLLLIVSDHGHKRGMHTPYGFCSCNKKLKLKNPKITDFAEVIRSQLGLPTREEEMKVYKHLKSLGYA